jgi:hypothetical protein
MNTNDLNFSEKFKVQSEFVHVGGLRFLLLVLNDIEVGESGRKLIGSC